MVDASAPTVPLPQVFGGGGGPMDPEDIVPEMTPERFKGGTATVVVPAVTRTFETIASR